MSAASLAKLNEQNPQLCCDSPDARGHLLYLRRHPQERIQWLDAALIAARNLNDQRSEGMHVGILGVAYSDVGVSHNAVKYHEQLLRLVIEAGDQPGEAQALGKLGSAYYQLNDFRKALSYYDQALSLFRSLGDRRGEGQTLQGIGIVYGRIGEARHAINLFEQHHQITIENGDRQGEGALLGNMAVAYRLLARLKKQLIYLNNDWSWLARLSTDVVGLIPLKT
jgi:tetratricopeptide (TPR) repeat protein